MGGAKKLYDKGKVRGDGDGGEEEQKEQVRELEEYVRIIEKKTELFSTFDADDIFQALLEHAEHECLSFQPASDKYKIKMEYMIGEGKKAE